MKDVTHLIPNRRVASQLFELGLDMAMPAHPETVFSTQAGLSIRHEIIAKALFQCAWLLTGKQTTAEWNELSLALQQRYRYLAERAIATIDPKVRLDTQQEAAVETSDWVNGSGQRDAVSVEDISNYSISTYEAKLAGVRVDVEQCS